MSTADRIQILYTPAELAPDRAQGLELHRIQASLTHGKVDPGILVELQSSGWLSQDRQTRGAYLSTTGLREHDHLELAILNVPSIFAAAAIDLLNDLAAYLIENETRFLPGELYVQERGENQGPLICSFTELDDNELFADPLLVVVPLR